MSSLLELKIGFCSTHLGLCHRNQTKEWFHIHPTSSLHKFQASSHRPNAWIHNKKLMQRRHQREGKNRRSGSEPHTGYSQFDDQCHSQLSGSATSPVILRKYQIFLLRSSLRQFLCLSGPKKLRIFPAHIVRRSLIHAPVLGKNRRTSPATLHPT